MVKKILRFILVVILIAIVVGGIVGFRYYKKVFSPNVALEEKARDLFLPTGADFPKVMEIINGMNILRDPESFEWVAYKMNYPKHIYPGRYIIKRNMSNRELVTMLRSGAQVPVKLTFNSVRTKQKLASVISQQIEADSTSILELLDDEKFLKDYGLTAQTSITVFLPNTYEIYWNTSAKKLFERMTKESKAFWNESRMAKLKKLNFTSPDAITLASIVNEESSKVDEMPLVAGVYINRLRKGMQLQADPTILFIKDYKITRVLNEDLEIDSPYNTYKNYGLPPGPICVPSIQAIEAVVNYKQHDYLYFCAKEDFSGYHNFARTLEEHNKNARLYQHALNKRKIYR